VLRRDDAANITLQVTWGPADGFRPFALEAPSRFIEEAKIETDRPASDVVALPEETRS